MDMNRHFAPLFPVILEVSITAIGDTVQGVSSVEGTFFITIKSIGRQKMKRKLLFAAMATLMAIYSAIGLAACKPSGEETEHKHQMQHVAAVAATCTEGGNSEYWTCSACGKYFSDAEGKKRDYRQILHYHFRNGSQLGRMDDAQRGNLHGRRL